MQVKKVSVHVLWFVWDSVHALMWQRPSVVTQHAGEQRGAGLLLGMGQAHPPPRAASQKQSKFTLSCPLTQLFLEIYPTDFLPCVQTTPWRRAFVCNGWNWKAPTLIPKGPGKRTLVISPQEHWQLFQENEAGQHAVMGNRLKGIKWGSKVQSSVHNTIMCTKLALK